MSAKNGHLMPGSAADAVETVQWALGTFGEQAAIASSFSTEDVIVIHMAIRLVPQVRVFALDTGRLDEETYECAEAVRRRFGARIEWYFPQSESVEKLEREQGLHSFRASVPARHECCAIRKVEPLSRALAGLQAWITGMRREQSVTRADIRNVEVDAAHGGIFKVNPLADWTTSRVNEYVARHDLPVNRLYSQGYVSIGCAPCTRAIEAGEDLRAGRWWWESPEHKECGLHANRLERPAAVG